MRKEKGKHAACTLRPQMMASITLKVSALKNFFVARSCSGLCAKEHPGSSQTPVAVNLPIMALPQAGALDSQLICLHSRRMSRKCSFQHGSYAHQTHVCNRLEAKLRQSEVKVKSGRDCSLQVVFTALACPSRLLQIQAEELRCTVRILALVTAGALALLIERACPSLVEPRAAEVKLKGHLQASSQVAEARSERGPCCWRP